MQIILKKSLRTVREPFGLQVCLPLCSKITEIKIVIVISDANFCKKGRKMYLLYNFLSLAHGAISA